jgi:hypothetical protein
MIRGMGPTESVQGARKSILEVVTPFRFFGFMRAVRDSPSLTNSASIDLLTELCSDNEIKYQEFKARSIDLLKSKLDTRSSRFYDAKICERLSLPSLSLIEVGA